MSSPLSNSAEAVLVVNAYPELDAATLASVNSKLIEIVSLRHGGGLSEPQLRELAACIEAQTANLETLHRFALANADEPAFALCMSWAAEA